MSLVLFFLLFVEIPSCCSIVLMFQLVDIDYYYYYFFFLLVFLFYANIPSYLYSMLNTTFGFIKNLLECSSGGMRKAIYCLPVAWHGMYLQLSSVLVSLWGLLFPITEFDF